MPRKSLESCCAETIRKAVIEENRRKVQRRKEEKRFIEGLHNNFKLSHLETIQAELKAEAESKRQNKFEFPEVSREPSPPPEETIRCVHSFSAPVRCLESTHGGSSLWTGEGDGAIGIRNGVTGDITYRIEAPPVDTPPLVDTLYATDNNMFVGLSDGSIRVYDQLVFVLAFEAKEHQRSVTAFSTTFDLKTFSASLDGTVARWDTESNGFAFCGNSGPFYSPPASTAVNGITSMCSYGYNVFVGTEGGVAVAVDMETLSEVRPYSGHSGSINAIAVQDGYLFTASSDTTAIVWNISSGEPLKVMDQQHAAPLTSIFCDPVAHNIWTMDCTGVMSVWSSVDDDDFCFIRRASHSSSSTAALDSGVFGLKGIVAIDALKVWSLGSNGVNKVWHASTNRIEEAIRRAIRSMKGVIDQDELELQKWETLILALQTVARRLNDNTSNAVEGLALSSVTRSAYSKWKRFVVFKQIRRAQQKVAAVMLRKLEQEQLRQGFSQWLQWHRHGERSLRQRQIAEVMRAEHQRRLMSIYAAKISQFVASTTRHRRAAAIAGVLQASTERLILKQKFSMMLLFRSTMQRERRLRQISVALESLNHRRVVASSFFDWRLWLAHKKTFQSQLKANACALFLSSQRDVAQVYWNKWRSFAQVSSQRRMKFRTQHLPLLRQCTGLLQLRYFANWKAWSRQRVHATEVERHTDGAAKVMELHAALNSVDHLLRRRALLDEGEHAIQAALAQQQKKKATIEQLKAEIALLHQKLEDKQNNAGRSLSALGERSLQEQVADLIAALKCKLINVHTDFGLMSKLSEKVRRVGASKVFLESHQAVKRVVVEMTKNGYLSSEEEWPITDAMLRKLKSHHCEVVLNAIKSMIITYDALTPQGRASLSSDGEIVINAHNLDRFAERCLAERSKRSSRR